jgi:hypothetical protein
MNEKAHQLVLNNIKNARVIFIEFKEKKYVGKLVESKPGEKMVFVVPKVDSHLCSKVLRGDPIALRIISGEGTIVAFESDLIEKKLPKTGSQVP